MFIYIFILAYISYAIQLIYTIMKLCCFFFFFSLSLTIILTFKIINPFFHYSFFNFYFFFIQIKINWIEFLIIILMTHLKRNKDLLKFIFLFLNKRFLLKTWTFSIVFKKKLIFEIRDYSDLKFRLINHHFFKILRNLSQKL